MPCQLILLAMTVIFLLLPNPVSAQAPPCGDFTVFEDGTPALAEHVNCNFELNSDAINLNTSRAVNNNALIVDVTSRLNKLEPSNVINVAKSGADFTTLSDAMDSIQDASADNPYLVKMAPGTYAEASGIFVKSNVSVEGAGPGLTTLTCDASNNCNNLLYMNNFTGRGIISDLTLAQSGASKTGITVAGNETNCGLTIESVEIVIDTGGGNSAGIDIQQCDEVAIQNVGIALDGAGSSEAINIQNILNVIIEDVDISSEKDIGDTGINIGVYSFDVQTLTIRDSRISAVRGVSARAVHAPSGGQLFVRNSELKAQSAANWNYALRLFNASAHVTGSTLGAGGSLNALTYFVQSGGSGFVRIHGSLIDNGSANCTKSGDARCFYCKDVSDFFLTNSFDEFCVVIPARS